MELDERLPQEEMELVREAGEVMPPLPARTRLLVTTGACTEGIAKIAEDGQAEVILLGTGDGARRDDGERRSDETVRRMGGRHRR